MAERRSTSVQTLKQLVDYDPHTGLLVWLPRPREMFSDDGLCRSWNSRYAGKEALGCVKKNGYKHGHIDHRPALAHRVCWAIYTGNWPAHDIDHINGDRTDNRIVNLRDVDRKTNGLNQKIPHDNKSGRIGVCWSAANEQWEAQIPKDGKKLNLGRYDDFQIACAVRYGAELALGYHRNHGRLGPIRE